VIRPATVRNRPVHHGILEAVEILREKGMLDCLSSCTVIQAASCRISRSRMPSTNRDVYAELKLLARACSTST